MLPAISELNKNNGSGLLNKKLSCWDAVVGTYGRMPLQQQFEHN